MFFDFKALAKHTVKHKPMVFIWFAVFFCVAQLSFVHHQATHKSNDLQSTCLICAFTPNQIFDSSPPLTFEYKSEEIIVFQERYHYIALVAQTHYLTRAPPVS